MHKSDQRAYHGHRRHDRHVLRRRAAQLFCVAAEGVHKSTIAHGTTEVMLSAVSGSLGEVIADAAESDEGLEEILDAVTDVIRICAREAWEKLGEGGGMIQ